MMRIPEGAPVPFWMGVRRRIPGLKRMSKPSLGTIAVAATVVITASAVYAVCVYPKLNNEYYKEAQKRERALIHASKEELAHGQRVWSDPFGRK